MPGGRLDPETDIVPVVGRLRPALVVAGIGAFFVGSLLVGQSLGATGEVSPFGALWMVVGVGVIGAGLAHQATGEPYDLDLEFGRLVRVAIGGISIGLLLLALAVVLAG